HSVLAMLEVRSEGRCNARPVDWWTIGCPEKLYHEPNHLMESDPRFLLRFDWIELAQMTGATLIVVGSCLGALTLRFFTPTVGFGCRSFTYLLFAATVTLLLVTEVLLYPWVRRPLRMPRPTQSLLVRCLRTSAFRHHAERVYVLLEAATTGFLCYII